MIPIQQQMQKSFQIQKHTPQIQTQVLNQIQPIAQPKPENFNLGKIEKILQDQTVQSIECPGPGKNILLKKFNRINTIRITLNEQEINTLIKEFSEKARIPTVGGILKAAVGNLVISAIISDFVGSRFIINRIMQAPMQR